MSRTESRILRTTSGVLDALTIQYVSELTGRPYKRVWEWGQSDTFPSRYFAVMDWALRKKGLRAHPKLWDQVTAPGMRIAA